MEAHRGRIDGIVADQGHGREPQAVLPVHLQERPCFHDEFLPAFNSANVTLIDCPAGIECITERGPVVDGKQYEVDCVIYGTGFEPERTPLARRAGHDIIGRGGLSLGEKWADGAASLYGMMSRGFPNMFVMPAPTQQSVVTVNYTQLAVLGAEFVGKTDLPPRGSTASRCSPSASRPRTWTEAIVSAYIEHGISDVRLYTVTAASQQRNFTRAQLINPRDGNYGVGMGDWFRYRDVLEEWLAAGGLEGLELEVRATTP